MSKEEKLHDNLESCLEEGIQHARSLKDKAKRYMAIDREIIQLTGQIEKLFQKIKDLREEGR